MVPVGRDDGLIDHLTLVRDRETVLPGQLTELFMREAHDYRMRMSIKRPRAVSIEIFPLTSKTAVGRKTIDRGGNVYGSAPYGGSQNGVCIDNGGCE
jgi:hypothetical protein